MGDEFVALHSLFPDEVREVTPGSEHGTFPQELSRNAEEQAYFHWPLP